MIHISDEKIIQSFRWNKSLEETARRMAVPIEDLKVRREEVLNKYGSIGKALDALQNLDDVETGNYIAALENELVHQYNLDKGTGFVSGYRSDKPLTPEEIEQVFSIDNKQWRLSMYWNKKQPNGTYLVSANITQIRSDLKDPEFFHQQFTEFLSTYTPKASPLNPPQRNPKFEDVALVLPRQDLHWNKYDIMGNNNINKRFSYILDATQNVVNRVVSAFNLSEVIYEIGSDAFNSEYGGTTTKGTPQQNILTYEGAFLAVCNHEVDTITYLLKSSKTVSIKYIPGNHDRFAGWHLITWLQAYFRDEKRISFDTSILNRKYVNYGNSAIMLNHGDVLKPADLASKFPIEYRKNWSECQFFYIVTGDKHHWKSFDFNGIEFYQVPALSGARSYWDDQEGHTCTKPEMICMVVTKNAGINTIIKEPIKL